MTATTFEREARYLRAGLDQLKDYLLSDVLFWDLGVNPPGDSAYPQFTLGNLLLARAFAQGLQGGGALSEEESRQLDKLNQHLDGLKTEWKSAWGEKAAREFDSRLKQWQEFIVDLKQHPERELDYYKSEVRVRTLLELLEEQVPDLSQETRQVLSLEDQRLRSSLGDSDFIWDSKLQSGFPQQEYWFLYAYPQKSNND